MKLAEDKEPFVTSPNQGETFVGNTLPPWEMIEVKKRELFEQPAHIGILGTVITSLALMGEIDEARYYLAQQRQQDLDGIRAHHSLIHIGAASGDIYRAGTRQELASGKELLAIQDDTQMLFDPRVLNDPDLNFNNGLLAFLLGDFEQGASHWRNLSSSDVRKLFTRLHASEAFLSRNILLDERYASLLDELGAGRNWQRQLMEGVMAMSAMTGVSLHDKSLAAYESNQFMAMNNLWSDAHWQKLASVREQRISEIRLLSLAEDQAK